MSKSPKKQAKQLFKLAKKELGTGRGVSHEELFRLLKEGNQELLPPDGIAEDADLKGPALSRRRRIWNALTLPKTIVSEHAINSMHVRRYICRVVEISRGEYGVILSCKRWGTREGNNAIIEDWVYPEKEGCEVRSF